MSLDLTPEAFLSLELKEVEWSDFVPDVLPPSILDVNRMPPMKMDQPMSDGCEYCGAFRMQVGDYVCYGMCTVCYETYSGE